MLLLTEAFISDPEHIEGGDMLSTEQLLLHIYLAEYKLHTTTKIKKKKKKFDQISSACIPRERH